MEFVAAILPRYGKPAPLVGELGFSRYLATDEQRYPTAHDLILVSAGWVINRFLGRVDGYVL